MSVVEPSDSWFPASPQDVSWLRDWEGVELFVPRGRAVAGWPRLDWIRRTLIDGGSSRLTRQFVPWMGPHLQAARGCWCLGFVGPQEIMCAGRTGTIDQAKWSCFFGGSDFHYK